MIGYRNMISNDIAGGISLCHSARWNQTEREWNYFLHHSADGCRVAESKDKVVGTVATLKYQHFFSWVGMLLVDPQFQKQGIGLQLLLNALDILQQEETVKLDATPAGRKVYAKLKFRDEYNLSRMQTNNGVKMTGSNSVRALQSKDIPALSMHDRTIFGADRRKLLEWLWQGAPACAFVMEENNLITGYCFGRYGEQYAQIGPVVANNMNVAQELVSVALYHCRKQKVIMDVSHHHPQWLSLLEGMGFVEQRTFTRMYYGSNRFPGIPEKQFAIAGPEFG